MVSLVSATEKQAKALDEMGVRNAMAQNSIVSGLSEQDKQIRTIAESYQPLIDAARATGNQELLNAAILQQQEAIQKKISDDRVAMAEEQKKIDERRAKEDTDRAIENEIYEIQRQRNLERTRAELERQTKENEERIANEKEAAKLQEEQRALKDTGGGAAKSRFQGKEIDESRLEFFKDILAGSRAGIDTLNLERKRRSGLNKTQNFRFQENFLGEQANLLSKQEGRTITRQDVMNRMAKQIVSGEIPTLEEKTSKQQDLASSLKKLVTLMETAPLVTSGAGSN